MQGNIKLTNLSSAELLPQKHQYVLLKKSAGSAGFKGPECILPYRENVFKYSLKTDSFPLGLILHALIFKTESTTEKDLGLFQIFKKVVVDSTEKNQFQRPSVEQLLKELSTLVIVQSTRKR